MRDARIVQLMLLVLLVVIAVGLAMPRTRAETRCIPELEKVNSALEDVQRIRVSGEYGTNLLREIRDSLKRKQ